MKNIIIVSKGAEVARVIHDTKATAIKAMVYQPVAGESNRSNCLRVVVHTLRQLVESNATEGSEVKDGSGVQIYGLNILNNAIGKIFSVRKTLKAINADTPEDIMKVFVEGGMQVSEQESALWLEFLELDAQLEGIKYKKLPARDAIESMKESASGFERRMALALETAWNKVPDIDITAVEDVEGL